MLSTTWGMYFMSVRTMFLKVYSLETVVGFVIWEVELNNIQIVYSFSYLNRTSPGSPTSGTPPLLLMVGSQCELQNFH